MITILMAVWLQSVSPAQERPAADACARIDHAVDGLNRWRSRWRAEALDPGRERAEFAAEQLERDPQGSSLSSAVAVGLRNEAQRMARQDERENRLAEEYQAMLGELMTARLQLCGVSRPEDR